MTPNKIKYIDLFAGVGGFRYGIERCHRPPGKNQQEAQYKTNSTNAKERNTWQPTLTCVYSNEWDKYANSVYKYHYGECDDRDIRAVKTNEIPDHDLLCAGFPCQAFSVAGKRGGFEDTRGTLFFEIARIASEKRPRYLLLENVKGLLSHDKGKTFQTILRVLSDLGYRVEWQVLNSKHFGVPQNRERVFIIGHLGGGSGQKVFPVGSANSENLRELTQNVSDAQRVYDSGGLAKTLKGLGGGMGAKTGMYAIRQPLRYLNRNQKKIEGDYAYTVDASQTSGIKTGTRIRRLTPTECERLQGFPDNWTAKGHDGKEISDTQRYKMMGNAVTTNVISAIMERLTNDTK